MADISDVEIALVQIIAATIAPPGYLYGSVATSPLGPQVRIARGWPVSDTLDADMKAGIVNVTVFSMPGLARNTTRFLRKPFIVAAPSATIIATQSSNTVTITGTAAAGMIIGVATGSPVSIYPYRILNTDTPATIAATLAGMIPGASVNGAVLTVPGLVASAVRADGTQVTELRRQTQGMKITLWCPSASSRDVFGSAIDVAFAECRSLVFPDGSVSDVPRYAGTSVSDNVEKSGIYRRDLDLMIEYGTYSTEIDPRVLFPQINSSADGGPPVTTTVV